MDPASLSMVIGLVSEGIGCVTQLRDLGRRVEAGDVVTPEERDAAKAEMLVAVIRWNAEAEHDHE